jgi:small-conductance mechanosensitive channel
MPPNNMVILPNSKLTQSVVTNYSLPDPETTMLIPISVSYTTEPDHVERVLLEETRKAMGHVPGLLAVPEPSVRLIPGFGTSSLDFTLACRVRDVDDQALVQHELRKRILKRFRAESIQMAVPQQVVQIQGLAGAPPKSPESGSA